MDRDYLYEIVEDEIHELRKMVEKEGNKEGSDTEIYDFLCERLNTMELIKEELDED